MRPDASQKKPNPSTDSRGSRLGKIVLAAGFWFFLIKGLVWLALFGAALFLGVEVAQASTPSLSLAQ